VVCLLDGLGVDEEFELTGSRVGDTMYCDVKRDLEEMLRDKERKLSSSWVNAVVRIIV
jgi:hypothetical protein